MIVFAFIVKRFRVFVRRFNGQNVVFALYLLLGIVAAVMTGLILRSTLYPGSSDSFIMEMPNYELPTIRNVVIKILGKS